MKGKFFRSIVFGRSGNRRTYCHDKRPGLGGRTPSGMKKNSHRERFSAGGALTARQAASDTHSRLKWIGAMQEVSLRMNVWKTVYSGLGENPGSFR